MHSVFRFSIAVLCLYSVLLLTACPAASLQTAHDQSARVASYANAGVDLTRDLFESKVITLGQKDQIAQKFILLAKAGEAFDTTVANAQTVYGSNAPKTEVEKAFAVFDSTVVAQFLDVLQSLKVIGVKDKYAAIIDTIRSAVLVVAGAFGKKSSVTAQLAAAL